MRGKLTKLLGQICIRRNIPAYAGKTDQNTDQSSDSSEHPRVCGENADPVLT